MNIFQCIDAAKQQLELMRRSNADSDKIAALGGLVDDLVALETELRGLEMDSHRFQSSRKAWPQEKFENCLSRLQKVNEKLTSMQPELTSRERRFKAAYPYLAPTGLARLASSDLQQFQLRNSLRSIQASIVSMNESLKNARELHERSNATTVRLVRGCRGNIKFLMNQKLIPGMGLSSGQCYGLSLDYAYHRRKTPDQLFAYSAEAARNQERYKIKNSEDQHLFSKRRGIMRYQPDLAKQAKELSDYAKANPGKQFMCVLWAPAGGHATMMEYTAEGKWHYFDPNYGAFEFDRQEDFNSFYQKLYSGTDSWHSYSISELVEKPPENTWTGKLRSLLTGARYNDGMNVQSYLPKAVVVATALILAASVFAASTFLLPAVLPIVFMTAGAIAGAIVGSMAAYAGMSLLSKVRDAQFNGLLALPRYLHYTYFGSKQQSAKNQTTESANQELDAAPGASSSTSRMLGRMPANQVSESEGATIRNTANNARSSADFSRDNTRPEPEETVEYSSSPNP